VTRHQHAGGSSTSALRQRDILVDGRRVRYVDAGDGPPIALIHGLGGSWQNWLENLPDLGRDHRVIALDLPGFGRSDPVPRPRSLAPHAATVAALLDRLGTGPTLVVGHSMGGLVAERLALQRPELVNGLVLVGAGGGGVGVRQMFAVHGMLVARRLAARPAVARRLARVRRLRHQALAGVVHDPACIPAALAEDMMAAFVAPGFADAVRVGLREDLRAELARIGCPALLVWGDRDRILPVSRANELAGLLPDAELEVWPGVGHCPMLERPAAFNARVRTFSVNVR
jgi:pimeloyl-ACP methyl ester carboxylesterase